ncbi:MAG: hypothetical protein ACT4UQ_04005 [Gammaproteobacteria bacterium]
MCAAILTATAALAACAPKGSALRLPAEVATHADGRVPIGSLYESYAALRDQGWILDVVAESQPAGAARPLPIVALRSPIEGPAVWILAGIHGEEPAGPNAIAAAIDDIARLGRTRPVVLLPLLNPHGYARNWRYLNVAVYSEEIDGASVGDSSHLLPDPDVPGRARAPTPSSPEADAITRWMLAQSARYPPAVSIDLHEDNLIHEGYVYSQGAAGAADPLAIEAIAVLRDNGVPIKAGGTTRFDELIEGGIIGPVVDSSIDELMSAATVIAGGSTRKGPQAATVLVFETPAAALPLPQRVAAHAALLRRLAGQLARPSG